MKLRRVSGFLVENLALDLSLADDPADLHFCFQIIAARSKFRELSNDTQHVAIGSLVSEQRGKIWVAERVRQCC